MRQVNLILWGLLIGFLLSFGSVPPITAHVVPIQNIFYLTKQAHVVCKGKVLNTRDRGILEQEIDGEKANITRVTIIFQIDKIFKGKVKSNIIEIEAFTSCDVPFINLNKEGYFLVFLDGPINDVYKFTDQYVGSMPITSKAIVDTNATDPLDLLELELLASLQEDDRKLMMIAIEQLGNLKHVRSTKPLKDLLQLPDQEITGAVYNSIIKLNDYSILKEAIKYIEQPTTDQHIQVKQAKIARSICFIRDQQTIPILNEQLILSKVGFLREYISRALRAMKNPSSVPYFIAALDDPAQEVRYQALMGLAEIEDKNGEWAPGIENFTSNGIPAVKLWKHWWQSEGKSKYAKLAK